jgi:hypothetical protein
MRPSALYLLAHLALVLLGAPAAFHPVVRSLGVAARVAAAFGAGAVLLTLEALLFSLLGIPWSIAALAAPMLVLAVIASRRAAARAATPPAQRRAPSWVALLAGLAALLGTLHLVVCLLVSRSTSMDYLFFWGVKAVHFADARGIDVALLKWPYFSHGVPEYPPLVPIVQAWGVLFAGEMPWRRAGPASSALWFFAALALVLALLRRRIGEPAATGVTGFWGAALAISLAHSYSGGNAEAPLLFFETVAALSLITESREDRPSFRWIPAVALAGAVLTKVEAVPATALLVLGTLARDWLERRPGVLRRAIPLMLLPALALASWFGFQLASGLPVGYRAHGKLTVLHWEHFGSVVSSMVKNLEAGTAGIAWIFPTLLLLVSWRRLPPVLPALMAAAGLLLFFAFDYLHDALDPWERIGWTLPRVSQSALSMVILAAGLAFFSALPRGEVDPEWRTVSTR